MLIWNFDTRVGFFLIKTFKKIKQNLKKNISMDT